MNMVLIPSRGDGWIGFTAMVEADLKMAESERQMRDLSASSEAGRKPAVTSALR